MLFDILGDEIWLFVLMVLDEEANVGDSDRWSSGDGRGTVHINCVVLNINQFMKLNHSLQKVIVELRLSFMVVDWLIYNRVDSLISIELFNGGYIDSSMMDFCLSLKIQNSGGSLASNFININLVERIWTKNDPGVGNLGGKESTQKVSVTLVDEAVDNVRFVDHGLNVSTLVTEMTTVCRWGVHGNAPLRLSFKDDLILELILLLKAVYDIVVSRPFFELSAVSRNIIWHLNNAFPWSHVHTVLGGKPVHGLLRSSHFEHLLSGSIALHHKLISVLVHREKDRESQEITLPFIMELDVNQVFGRDLGGQRRSSFGVSKKSSGLGVTNVWQKTELSDSVNTCFPLNHCLLVIIE